MALVPHQLGALVAMRPHGPVAWRRCAVMLVAVWRYATMTIASAFMRLCSSAPLASGLFCTRIIIQCVWLRDLIALRPCAYVP